MQPISGAIEKAITPDTVSEISACDIDWQLGDCFPINAGDFYRHLSLERQYSFLRIKLKTNSRTAAEMEADKQAAEELRLNKQRERNRKAYKADCGLSGAMWQETLDTFDLDTRFPTRAALLQKLKNAANCEIRKVKRGLMIWGKPGRGKSKLARGFVAELLGLEDPVRALYVNCWSLNKQMQESKTKTGPTLLQQILQADVVVLDDIEKALAGDAPVWVRELMKTALDEIETQGRPLVIATSNHPLTLVGLSDEDQEEYAGNTHQENLPPALYSRFVKLFHAIKLDGVDYREKQAEEETPYWV